jgi:hypothetical protein
VRKKSFKPLFTALETITFQNDSNFTKSLDDLCIELIDAAKNSGAYMPPTVAHHEGTTIHVHNYGGVQGASIDSIISQIQSLFVDRFNMNIQVRNDPEATNPIFILTPYTHHSFISSMKRDIHEVVNNKILGTIDTNKAVVTGGYSDKYFYIGIDINTLVRYLSITPREVAAILLHEVGHAFSFLEYTNRVIKASLILSELQDINVRDITPEKLSYVFASALKEFDPDNHEHAGTQNTLVLSSKVFSSILKTFKTEISSTSDTRTSERAADLFASRFGYGRELVTVISKMEALGGNVKDLFEHNNVMLDVSVTLTFLEILYFVASILGLYLGVAIIATTPWLLVGSLAFLGLGALVISGHAELEGNLSYDNLFDRINRLRMDCIQQLKTLDPKKDKELISECISNIELLDNKLQNIKRNKSVVDEKTILKIQKALDKDDGHLMSMEIETLLENIANNALFVDSAKLKLLGS